MGRTQKAGFTVHIRSTQASANTLQSQLKKFQIALVSETKSQKCTLKLNIYEIAYCSEFQEQGLSSATTPAYLPTPGKVLSVIKMGSYCFRAYS